jgi:hypothetical protein
MMYSCTLLELVSQTTQPEILFADWKVHQAQACVKVMMFV